MFEALLFGKKLDPCLLSFVREIENMIGNMGRGEDFVSI